MSEQIEDLSSYGQDNVDISLTDIPIPEVSVTEEVNKVEDKFDAAYKFAFVGAGQGGGRLAETFYKFGYRRVCAINTAPQDLNTIDVPHKLCIGEGGAGKNMGLAREKYTERKEDAYDLFEHAFGNEFDKIFVCAGAGGGSGAGTIIPIIDTAHDLQKRLGTLTKKVGVILALPKISEGKKVNANAFHTLKKVFDYVDAGVVSPLILVDNEKMNKLYPNLAVAPFWDTANRSIAGLFHLFNMTASKDSSYSSFDPQDYKQILESGFILYGASPVPNWKDAPAFNKHVRDQVKGNLLSDGADLHTGNQAGVLMIAGNEILEQVPQKNLDSAFEQFTRILKTGSTVYRGIYSGDRPNLTVYTVIGGLARPFKKIEELKKLGDVN